MPSKRPSDYDVEEIIDKRINGNGRPSYLIKWKGYPSSENTWEPESHVKNCQDLIRQFENEFSKRNSSTSIARRSAQKSKYENQVLSPVKNRSSRSRSRHLNVRSAVSESKKDNHLLTDDEDQTNTKEKSIETNHSSRRSRRSQIENKKSPTTKTVDGEVPLDSSNLEQILDARRNRRTNQVEYQIQWKNKSETVWLNSEQLTRACCEQIVNYFEKKYL